MKTIKLLVLSIFLFQTGFAQSTDNSSLTRQRIMKQAQPVYDKASWDIFQLSENLQLAKQHLVAEEIVIKNYTDIFGKQEGNQITLKKMERHIRKAGDAYIRLQFYKEVARISREEGVEPYFIWQLQCIKKKDRARI